MKQTKAFQEDDGYQQRQEEWMVGDDYKFLNPEPLTIYTSLPNTSETVDYYLDCFPECEIAKIVFGMDQEELALYTTEGE